MSSVLQTDILPDYRTRLRQRDVYKYYYGLAKEEGFVTGTADTLDATAGTGDQITRVEGF